MEDKSKKNNGEKLRDRIKEEKQEKDTLWYEILGYIYIVTE